MNAYVLSTIISFGGANLNLKTRMLIMPCFEAKIIFDKLHKKHKSNVTLHEYETDMLSIPSLIDAQSSLPKSKSLFSKLIRREKFLQLNLF